MSCQFVNFLLCLLLYCGGQLLSCLRSARIQSCSGVCNVLLQCCHPSCCCGLAGGQVALSLLQPCCLAYLVRLGGCFCPHLGKQGSHLCLLGPQVLLQGGFFHSGSCNLLRDHLRGTGYFHATFPCLLQLLLQRLFPLLQLPFSCFQCTGVVLRLLFLSGKKKFVCRSLTLCCVQLLQLVQNARGQL